jgi:NADH dehydrogenase [ubiquinone] 1 alpha subcomplex assembly factor 7
MNELPAITDAIDVSKLDTAKPLAEVFQPFSEKLKLWESQVDSLTVTDVSQVAIMKQAREARLELRRARTDMEKLRVSMVEGLKKRTGAIDSAARVIKEKFERLEEKLRASEEFAERAAAAAKERLRVQRTAELQPFMDTPIFGDIAELTDEHYTRLLENARLAQDARARMAEEAKAAQAKAAEEQRLREEAEAKAAAERKAQQDAELQRVREANQKLEQEMRDKAEEQRKINAEIERKAAAEKAALELENQRLRQAQELKDAAERERLEAERRAKEEQEAAERAARNAPDKAKLIAFANEVQALKAPELVNVDLQIKIAQQVQKFASWVASEAVRL